MTVGELVEKLKSFDPELPVVIDGYEGGLEDVKIVRSCLIIPNYHDEGSSIFGPHSEVLDEAEREYHQRHNPEYKIVDAVYIPRTGN